MVAKRHTHADRKLVHTVRMQVRSPHSILATRSTLLNGTNHVDFALGHLANASEAAPATASMPFQPLPVAVATLTSGFNFLLVFCSNECTLLSFGYKI